MVIIQRHVIAYEGKEPYVFLSYCHKDRPMVYPIFEMLAMAGCRVWYDSGNHGGDDWQDNIEEHLEGARAMIALISSGSSLSHNCKSEITYALQLKIKVIPVLIENVPLPKGLRMQLSHLHHIKAYHYSGKDLLDELLSSEEVRSCVGTAGLIVPTAAPVEPEVPAAPVAPVAPVVPESEPKPGPKPEPRPEPEPEPEKPAAPASNITELQQTIAKLEQELRLAQESRERLVARQKQLMDDDRRMGDEIGKRNEEIARRDEEASRAEELRRKEAAEKLAAEQEAREKAAAQQRQEEARIIAELESYRLKLSEELQEKASEQQKIEDEIRQQQELHAQNDARLKAIEEEQRKKAEEEQKRLQEERDRLDREARERQETYLREYREAEERNAALRRRTEEELLKLKQQLDSLTQDSVLLEEKRKQQEEQWHQEELERLSRIQAQLARAEEEQQKEIAAQLQRKQEAQKAVEELIRKRQSLERENADQLRRMSSELDALTEKIRAAEEQKRLKEETRKQAEEQHRKEEEARRAREAEEQRQRELARLKAEEERRKEEEAARLLREEEARKLREAEEEARKDQELLARKLAQLKEQESGLIPATEEAAPEQNGKDIHSLLIDPTLGHAYPLWRDHTNIGRSPIRCDVVVDDPAVSKLHAQVRRFHDRISLMDLGSAHGTFCNGALLQANRPVVVSSPAWFYMHNRPLLLLFGTDLSGLMEAARAGDVPILMNAATGAYQILQGQLRLDREHTWPDGTLNDSNIHRSSHAAVDSRADGVYLTDAHPVNGNGVFLNETKMEQGASVKLASGDLIRLGKTTLIYLMLDAQEG